MGDLPKASEAVCLTLTIVLVVPPDWLGGDLGLVRAAVEEALQKYAPGARYGYPPLTISAVTLPRYGRDGRSHA